MGTARSKRGGGVERPIGPGLAAPGTPAALHEWLRRAVGIELPTRPLTAGNAAPFEYVGHTFFEGRRFGPAARALGAYGPADAVVWAARGGGKTFLGAVATMLDLVFKPGIEVRILGGSLEQSQRMHEHLRRLFESRLLAPLLDGAITQRRVQLRNGSRAQVLAQSHTSVRGTRVQKVRCDEAELFDRDVWEAAQLATRSLRLAGPWGSWVRGSIEALSTMHKPYGLMWNIVGESAAESSESEGEGGQSSAGVSGERIGERGDERGYEGGNGRGDGQGREESERRGGSRGAKRRLFRWGIVDVLGACGDEHRCESCVLMPECAGRAKAPGATEGELPAAGPAASRGSEGARVAGHVSIDDALRMKARVGEDVWRAEMLCQRPRRSDSVYPEFDTAAHVGAWESIGSARAEHGSTGDATWVAGMDFGFRSPTVVLLARHDAATRTLHIEAEHVQSEWTIEQHVSHMLGGMGIGLPAPAWIGVDPAGHQRSEQTGISCVAALRKAGLVVRSRRMELHEGVTLVRARLRPAGGAGGASPTLYIHRRCERLIEAMQRYHYPEDRLDSLQPVKDGFDHAADALRYLVLNLDRPHRTTCANYL